ncbi:MAG: hypothetical protein IJP94_03595 [Clostridia bacterium]|nr:hypothetical protein [Clostridia bacterium]
MKKRSSIVAVLVMLSMLISMIPMTVVSAETGNSGVKISYSVDGEDFTEVSGSEFTYNSEKAGI